MRIQHNIAAMNSYRNFSANNSSLNKNLEKLSTGYKINRAGDDAAGLAISEKMRAQISGLEGATKNAKDGISLVQTAEGALTEVHDMLNRMTTLAEQSANGTYQDELDREQLQKEIGQLQSEIDRIADSTNFNGLKLLDGSLDSTTVTTDTTEWSNIKDSFLAPNTNSGVVGSGTILHQGTSKDAVSAEFTVELNNLTPAFNLDQAQDNTRDSVSITIGEGTGSAANQSSQVLKVTADEIYRAHADGDTMTQATAKAFAYKYGGDAYKNEAAEAGITQVSPSDEGVSISYDYTDEAGNTTTESQKFNISLGDAGQLKFTQATAPTEGKDVADTRLKVKVETTNYGVEAESNADNGQPWSIGDIALTTDAGEDLMTTLASGVSFDLKYTDTESAGNDGNGEVSATDKLTFSDVGSLGADIELQYMGNDGNWTTVADAEEITFETDGGTTAKAIDVSATGINFRIQDTTGSGKTLATFRMDFNTTDASEVADNTFTLKSVNENTSALTDYNASTTVITEPTVKSSAKLASTYIEANDLYDNVQDGYQMKIGDETYTFAVGSSSKVDTTGTNVVDLTDLKVNNTGKLNDQDDIQVAMRRLTEVAKGNAMYSVGFDKNATSAASSSGRGHLTLTENIDYSGDADLTTRAGIGATIQFSKGATSSTSEASGKALTLQIGDTADGYNKLSVNITDMHAASLGIGADDLDISTQEGAAAALDKIKSAVNKVSDVRGNLGALQNRLDHTINNLGVMRENVQNAESQIRDTDVAEEMMNYTKNNILNQSAQAMLAQANQLPQGVLQLLG